MRRKTRLAKSFSIFLFFFFGGGLKILDSTTPSEGNLEFVCTVEQLQDLVGQLKDACKSIERGLG
jgi:hypothetical protein